MAAPAAAEVPVLAYLVVGLLALLGWVVCRGLRGVWIHTLGLMLVTLADVLKYDKAFIHIDFGGPIRALNTTILNAITTTGQKFEHSAGYFFHGAAIIQGWAARELFGLARDVLAWGQWLQHSHLPKWVKALIYAAVPPLLILRLVKAAIAANLPHVGRVVVTKVTSTVVTRVKRIVVATAGAVAIPGWVIHLPRRVGRIESRFPNIWHRLRKLELLLGATGAAVLVARALGVGSAKCIRSGNIGRAARRWCGLDGSIVTALLAGLIVLEGPISLEQFARELLDIETELTNFVLAGFTEMDGIRL